MQYGDAEYVRKRMVWTIQRLSAEIHVAEETILAMVAAQVSTRLAPPRIIGRSLNALTSYAPGEAAHYNARHIARHIG